LDFGLTELKALIGFDASSEKPAPSLAIWFLQPQSKIQNLKSKMKK
jgi:hypothetical protein